MEIGLLCFGLALLLLFVAYIGGAVVTAEEYGVVMVFALLITGVGFVVFPLVGLKSFVDSLSK